MRTKNTKLTAELRRLARRGRLSERSWAKHQSLAMPWGETYMSSTRSALANARPELRSAFEASYKRNAEGYQYLASAEAR
jgi:hypothetical protein